jgi:hypothetical protein
MVPRWGVVREYTPLYRRRSIDGEHVDVPSAVVERTKS